MTSYKFAFLGLLASVLPNAIATTMACPDLAKAVQVGVCPTEAQLRDTFSGYCSDAANAYAGATGVCTDFNLYRQKKNTVLWESADGAFDAYVSCDLPKETWQAAKVSGLMVSKKGKQTQLVCRYAEGITFIHRTRAECLLDSLVDCAGNPKSCQASCN